MLSTFSSLLFSARFQTSAFVFCDASSIDIVIMTATKVVVKFIVFHVAVLGVVVMVGLAARRVVISGIRASRGPSRVGDAGAEEGEGTGTKTCLRGVFAFSGVRRSRGVFRVRVVRGACGLRWACGVRGVRGFRGDRRLCGVREDRGIRGANGDRGSSGGAWFLGSVGFVGSEGPRGLWAQVGFVVRFVGYMGRRVRGAVGSVGSWDPLGFLGSLRSVATVESEGPGRLRGPWGGRVCGVPGIREVRESAGIVGSWASMCYPRRTDFRSSSHSWGSWAP